MSFDKLLAELDAQATEQDTMRKALPADDGSDEAKIQAAAAEGGGNGGDGATPEEDEAAAAAAKEKGGDPMGKSLGAVTLQDGTKVEAVDGTELVKSLMADVEALKAGAAQTESQMAKALEGAVGLIKSQGEMIKSLTESVKKLSNEGRGRKAVLTVVEKTATADLQKSEPTGMNATEFMAKSNAAFDAGKINGKELTTIDVSLRSGVPIDAALISKVVA